MAKGTSMVGVFGWLAIALASSPAQAQDANTVGDPQLKDFQLPGTRTVPPANTQQQPTPPVNATTPPLIAAPPAPSAQRPAAPPPASNEPETGEARPAPSRARPTPRQQAPVATPPARVPIDVPTGMPAPAELDQALAPPPSAAPPAEAAPPPPPAEQPQAPQRHIPWLYIALGTLLALIGLLGLFALKRRKASAADRMEAAAESAEPQADASVQPDPLFAKRAAAAPPVQVPVAPPSAAAPPDDGFVGVSVRPRLELEFKADRAAATLTEASVQYRLTIRNVGNRAACNVRIQIHMTNAGPDQDKEIEAFFAKPVRGHEPAIPAIAPQAEIHINSGIVLPREDLREITIQGRRLFIPIVAFNVYYEWPDGRTAQTSMSYLVGREAPTPQEKMGAFRLDLGPRLYRSVGQRQAKLAKVV